MKTENKKIPAILLCVLLVCTMSGCRQEGKVEETGLEETADISEHASASTVTLTEGKFSEEKLDDTWNEELAISFLLENDKVSVKEKASGDDENSLKEKAELSGSTIVIRKEGTYVFSGTLANGQIIVDADKEETVRLVFQGVNITSSDSAPVYSKSGNVIITLADGTENRIEDGSTYSFEQEEEEPNGAIFAKDDLTFNGNGTLHVIGNYNHGIQCKDDLKFVAGTYMISAVNDGIVGKDSVSVKNGNFTIESGDDGVKASNAEDSEKGYILIENGVFQIAAGGDGIQAETLLRINDGEFKITTGEGSGQGETVSEAQPDQEWMPEGKMTPPKDRMPREGIAPPEDRTPQEGAEPPEDRTPQEGVAPPEDRTPQEGMAPSDIEASGRNRSDSKTDDTDETSEASSTKGLKSYVELMIAGGEFDLDTQDDGLHSNQNVTIQGGAIKISTGDDGIHAEKTLTVEEGSIDIQKSYEGLEGFDIIINEGDIKIISSDDGINAAGTSANHSEKVQHFMEDEDQGASMTINGGEIYVNADGDGLDANGDIFINGGRVTVHGPANGGNGTLDYAVTCKITGGTFIGIGSIGMAQAPSEASTQASLIFHTDRTIEEGTAISLKDKDGNILAETITKKNAQWIAISAPKLTVKESYLFCAGTTEKEVIPTEIVTQFSF